MTLTPSRMRTLTSFSFHWSYLLLVGHASFYSKRPLFPDLFWINSCLRDVVPGKLPPLDECEQKSSFISENSYQRMWLNHRSGSGVRRQTPAPIPIFCPQGGVIMQVVISRHVWIPMSVTLWPVWMSKKSKLRNGDLRSILLEVMLGRERHSDGEDSLVHNRLDLLLVNPVRESDSSIVLECDKRWNYNVS